MPNRQQIKGQDGHHQRGIDHPGDESEPPALMGVGNPAVVLLLIVNALHTGGERFFHLL